MMHADVVKTEYSTLIIYDNRDQRVSCCVTLSIQTYSKTCVHFLGCVSMSHENGASDEVCVQNDEVVNARMLSKDV